MARAALSALCIAVSVWLWLQDHSIEISGERGAGPPLGAAWDIFKPGGFHDGERRAALAAAEPFFEGWYIKSVADDGSVLAIIPGVFHARGGGAAHAFVMLFDSTGAASKVDFPVEQFRFVERGGGNRGGFDVRIGANRFSDEGVVLDLPGVAKGELRYEGGSGGASLLPWPISLVSPGVMGPFAWAPWMECSHGVLSLSHAVHGSVRLLGRHAAAAAAAGGVAHFSGSAGYIEKDRGNVFPAHWLWMQTNNFDGDSAGDGAGNSAGGSAGRRRPPRVSLSASIARVPLPLIGRYIDASFPGFIVGLLVGDRLYRFASYSGAVTSGLQVQGKRVEWTLEDARHRLRISAKDGSAEGGRAPPDKLWGPRDGVNMLAYVNEGLHAEVNVTLCRKAAPWSAVCAEVLYRGTGRHGGIEIMAHTEQLFAQPWLLPAHFATPLHHPGAALCLLAAVLLARTPGRGARSRSKPKQQ